jgi:hypothetical protein
MGSSWQSTLEVFWPVFVTASARMVGSTNITAQGHIINHRSATMTGASAVSARGRVVQRGKAEMIGATNLTATPRKRLRASAQMVGSTILTATPHVISPTLYHILFTGQSNAIGGGSAVFTTAAAANGYMFAGGPIPGSTSAALASLVPLHEVNDGGVTGAGQTPATTMVNYLNARLADLRTRWLVSNVAIGGAPYSNMKKGTTPYNDSLAQVTAAKARAAEMGMDYKFLAIVNVHGEQDDATPVLAAQYKDNLIAWQSDYATDIAAITGQPASSIPMFLCQQLSYPAEYRYASNVENGTALQLYRANLAQPDKVVLVCAENFMRNIYNPHFDSFSYAFLGEYFGKAIHQHCFAGTRFTPVYPLSATLTGNTVVINFYVPVGPIQANFDWVGYRKDWGLRFYDSTASAAVDSVAITGPAQITVTLTATPTGSNPAIRYLTRNDKTSYPGSGPICDSETNVGPLGIPLRNYCVVFNCPLA